MPDSRRKNTERSSSVEIHLLRTAIREAGGSWQKKDAPKRNVLKQKTVKLEKLFVFYRATVGPGLRLGQRLPICGLSNCKADEVFSFGNVFAVR